MTCTPNYDLDHRVISFTSEHVLNGEYSASVLLMDPTRLDDPTNVAEEQPCGSGLSPIKINIDVVSSPPPETPLAYGLEGTVGDNTSLETCMIDTPTTIPNWVYGIKQSYDKSIENGTASISVTSFYEHLKGKAISTQQFKGAYIETVFDTIFSYYLGIPNFLVNVVDYGVSGVWEFDTILGPIEGADTYAELQALCTAVGANLFVQTDGRLTIEKWKDDQSPVEYAILPRMTISAEPAGYEKGKTTIIRVRGASLGMLDCGDLVMSNNDDTDGTKKKGAMKKVAVSGIKTKSVKITHNNLSGNQDDIRNALELSPTVERLGGKKDLGSGTYTARYTPKSLETFFGPDPTSIDFLIYGTKQSKQSEGFYGDYFGPKYHKSYSNTRSFENKQLQWMAGMFPIPFSSFGKGAFGTAFFNNKEDDPDSKDGKYQPDQPTFQQIEIVATAPSAALVGPELEEIGNKYVYTKEKLFELAVRRFKEIKMAENTWNVKTGYLPCLKLNQVVTFHTLDTEDAPSRLITGIVGGISLEHTVTDEGPETYMNLSIMSTDCLGKDQYTSSNLVNSKCAGDNSSTLNPWQTSALGLDQQSGMSFNNGYLLTTPGTSLAYMGYSLDTIDTSAVSYNWSFDYYMLQGTANLFLTMPTSFGTGSLTLAGSGTASDIIIPGLATSRDFVWQLMATGAANYYSIRNFTVTKTVNG